MSGQEKANHPGSKMIVCGAGNTTVQGESVLTHDFFLRRPVPLRLVESLAAKAKHAV
jgi:hypothetical protein